MSCRSIYNLITSEEFIYSAVVRAPSTIMNVSLLDNKEQKALRLLEDRFNEGLYRRIIQDVQKQMKVYIGEESTEEPSDFIETTVFFTPKKVDSKGLVCRPLHTATLIDQIVIIALLQALVYQYEFNELNGGIDERLSSICKIIPSSFYGNVIDQSPERLFKPWRTQYSQYCKRANECLQKYRNYDPSYCEISLDLKNFFPSINPKVVEQLLIDKLSVDLTEADRKILIKIIHILSFFKLRNNFNETERKWYFGKDNQESSFIKGIPQGLPHAYFFANIYMSEIAEIYSEVYGENKTKPEMYFYVDDSVIYTKEQSTDSWFANTIKTINDKIQIKNQVALQKKQLFIPFGYNYEDDDFIVEVHQAGPDSKSVKATISQARKDKGLLDMHMFCREISMLSFDLKTIYSEDEIKSLQNRVKALSELIENKIGICKANSDETGEYEKRLYRYKKYFKLRSIILDFQKEATVEELQTKVFSMIEPFVEDSNLMSNDDLQRFLDIYKNDVFESLLSFVLARAKEEENVIIEKNIYKKLEILQKRLGIRTENSYLYKRFPGKGKTYGFQPVDKYDSLKKKIIKKFSYLKNAKWTMRNEKINYILNEIKDGKDQILFGILGINSFYAWSVIYRSKSKEILRMLLNAIYSYVNSYTVSDTFEIGKSSKNPITYSELRILNKLRSADFDINSFIVFWNELQKSSDIRIIAEYQLLQVLPIFKNLVQNADHIDSLILVHKYCTDTWRNGSKQLYFYTLHNQEHAVSLIKTIVKIVHTVSFFQPKQFDFYLLFAACYLHDISMVRIPDESTFLIDNTGKSDALLNDIEKEHIAILNLDKATNIDVASIRVMKKQIIFDCYKGIDKFLEEEVRKTHADSSAFMIKNICKTDLPNVFSDLELDIISKISIAHGYADRDVYYLKGDGKDSPYNLKQDAILLRLADLLDMDRYRISSVVLKNNLEKMNEVSRFHWISHLLTSKCEFHTEYRIEGDAVIESLVVEIYTRFKEMLGMPSKKCKQVANCNISEDKVSLIMNHSNEYDKCQHKECFLYCRWCISKNEFLVNELNALAGYLNRLYNMDAYFFKSNAKINLQKDNEDYDMPQNMYDYLLLYLKNR